MKRKPITLALALMLIVSAALWGINYRLDHPPLSDADIEFRELVAGADKVEFIEWRPTFSSGDSVAYIRYLNVAQTRELMERLRLLPISPARIGAYQEVVGLTFYRGNQELGRFRIGQTPPLLAPPSVTTLADSSLHRSHLKPAFR